MEAATTASTTDYEIKMKSDESDGKSWTGIDDDDM